MMGSVCRSESVVYTVYSLIPEVLLMELLMQEALKAVNDSNVEYSR